MIQNSVSQWRKKATNPFIFEKIESPFDKKSSEPQVLLVNTKPSANEHLPLPKDFQFEPCLLPTRFEDFADRIRNFKVREDDVWILGYPNSGTKWLQNIIWQLKCGIDRTKKPEALFLEKDAFDDGGSVEAAKNLDSIKSLDGAISPRIIKSHLPPNLLPVEFWTVQPKIIYIARNPKDVAVSIFQQMQNDGKIFSGTIEKFFDHFLEDKNWYAPFHAHVNSFWQQRNEKNILFLTNEDLSEDLLQSVKRTSEFLQCSHIDAELKLLADHV